MDEIWLFYARNTGNLVLATQIVEAITEKFELLVKFPFMGRSRASDLGSDRRSFPVDEYIISYRIRRGEVQIVRVLHTSRNPEAISDED